jgi:dTDP-4-amino-4,6-dideoxygalactose transaminase
VTFVHASVAKSFGKISNRHALFFGSGTQALAAALLACKNERPRATEVILPAYGCPDLISAALFAKLTPRLVDLVDDSAWSVNMAQLRDKLGDATVAVVAVNLFGIGDEAAALSEVAGQAGVPLIQDSAQAFSRVTAQHWMAPYVVLSFGRGKPLNMLGGGALLTERPVPLGDVAIAAPSSFREALLKGAIAAAAFNVVTHPSVYWLASKLPGLGVGATIFKPLDALEQPSVKRRYKLARSLEAKLSAVPAEADWTDVAQRWSRLGIKMLAPSPQDRFGLLRFAALAASEAQRDQIVRRLSDEGLGVSTMYGAALNELGGIPDIVRSQGPFPNASSFARRLFTLPTHTFVDHHVMTTVDREIQRIASV